ncbi:DRAP deaminase [Cryptococcus neoformans Tu401-1]|nr:DRAP deaminase [Cryptococcus neoformans var. grubii Bt85]OXG18911.1 DRAP deaminase [Cryptococcus neoformans var. grubii Tu401-1]OXM79494.1 DRAP deaminase [Cryptococcus neoformans var. grubii Bt63]
MSDPAAPTTNMYPRGMNPRLRYIKSYWWPYKTFVKQRWIGRQLLEVITTEFRDRSLEYYRHALESGVTRVNGVVARPDLILRNGDRIDNTVHRHEPPVTNDPILVLHIDREREFIVISKPGSLPVHAAGRYFKHTVLEMMESDYGLKCYSVNRLDRLTSGLMILALSGKAASKLAREFAEGKVKKEYVARVKGKFPEEEITVDKPMMTVDRQMGLVIITPEGKDAVTIFNRIAYDPVRDQSVIRCRPQTGRTHQIRVHLQYLGHPIANDPLYGVPSVWGPSLGKGGVDLTPSTNGISQADALKARAGTSTPQSTDTNREYDNIDLNSPIRLSNQAREIIAKLRRQKDDAEDWIKWSEVIFSAKKAQDDLESESKSPAPQVVPRLTGRQEALKLPDPLPDDTPSPLKPPVYLPPGFCTECYVPVPDDPDPETLFIYLHALRYTTEQLGTWETPMPRWASADWDGDWRGWEEGAILPNALEEDRRKREIETAKKADSVLSNNLGDEALTPVALAGGSVQGR